MLRYAVKRDDKEKILSILNYDEDKKEFSIDIPKDVTEREAPFMMSLFVKRGISAYRCRLEHEVGQGTDCSKQQTEYWADIAGK